MRLKAHLLESFDLQHWTHIGAMNPFLQRKPKRQRTGAVQDLAEARKHLSFACVLECGSPLPLSDERFIGSFHDSMIAPRGHELWQSESAPKERAADVSSADPSVFCRQDAGSTLRFMESLNLQDWTRIGAMDRVRWRSAGFQTCCIADFQVGRVVEFGWPADLEIRDTQT